MTLAVTRASELKQNLQLVASTIEDVRERHVLWDSGDERAIHARLRFNASLRSLGRLCEGLALPECVTLSKASVPGDEVVIGSRVATAIAEVEERLKQLEAEEAP